MSERFNGVGEKYGRLTAMEFVRVSNKRTIWKWRCDCGKMKEIPSSAVKGGAVQSCGCLRKERVGTKRMDHTGEKYGRLTAIEFVKTTGSSHDSIWKFQCDCGKMKNVIMNKVKRGDTRSCGCLQRENSSKRAKEKKLNYRHGDANVKRRVRMYKTWTSMRERCHNPHKLLYERYGGRGICICEEWNDYLVFKEWALNNGYTDDLTIDRIENDGNYEPSNCQWITKSENSKKMFSDRKKGKLLNDLEKTKCPLH